MAEGCFFIKANLWRRAESPGRSTYSGPADLSAIRSSDYHSKCLSRFGLTLLLVAMATKA